MRIITKAELDTILAEHAKWAISDGGSRADLSGAYLSDADLRDADLRGAYLSGANLRDAYLSGADLSGADLSGAYLSGADLSGADLSGANLRGAYLSGADLSGANLRDADLRGAYLRGAYLSGADLSGANLRDADLRGAYLSGADLSGAYLSGADLSGADLSVIRDDFFAVLNSAPNEVPGLLAALREGRIDGTTYSGDCACLVGTIANVRHCDVQELPDAIKPNAQRPAERWFLAINRGATPATNQVAAITEGWISDWIVNHPTTETP